MNGITEFLASINIWLAVVLVDFSVFLIGYTIVVCVQLVKNQFWPKEYSEPDDYYDIYGGSTTTYEEISRDFENDEEYQKFFRE